MADDPDAPTAAIVVDADGRVSGWSDGGRLLLGWSPEDVLGVVFKCHAHISSDARVTAAW
ncbi:PAS domain-containing protein [Streptomyces sp. R08]|uniref:PAS domain-containing protein n=1 Tax=Streptomyces sp. R08 TaxID=3238624 RepID=A0AB39MT29_9ACTN